MKTAKQTRTHNTPLPLSAIHIDGSVLAEDVPPSTRVPGQRKWQELGSSVLKLSEQGRWLVVTLEVGHDPDVVRTGLKEEIRRSGKRLDCRIVRNADMSSTIYLFALEVDNAT